MTHGKAPVFPIKDVHHGLTKRELFAAMAMQGMLPRPGMEGFVDEAIAAACVSMADALIEELAE